MTRKPHPPDAFSPEESRYLDGEATPEEGRRLKHQLAADPERAKRVDAWREAMDLWREDAAHVAETSAADDPDALADRILDAGGATSGQPVSAVPAAARWYAAAAVLLIALGLVGTFLTGPRRPETLTASHPPRPIDAEFEAAVVDILLDSPELMPSLASSEEGR